MIASILHRPLLATFARGVDLPAPLARHVHGLLLRTAPQGHPLPVRARHRLRPRRAVPGVLVILVGRK